MDLYGKSFVESIIHQYIRAVAEDPGKRAFVHRPPRDPNHAGWLHASELGYCPLKSAMRRAGKAAKFPELLPENDLGLTRRLELGNRVAEIIQEAFLWWGTTAERWAVEAEKPVELEGYGISGRIDIFLGTRGGGRPMIYEIKHRSGVLQPKPADLIQLMIYGMITGSRERLILVGQDAWTIEVYRLGFDDGFGAVVLLDETDQVYLLPDSGEPLAVDGDETITWLIRNHNELYQQILKGKTPEPPIEDFFLEEEGWQCYKNAGSYPNAKAGTPGYIQPRCPYGCHFQNLRAVPYWKTPDGQYHLEDPKTKKEGVPF